MALKVVGSNPTNHPMNSNIYWKKKRIKRRKFKKKTHLISNINLIKIKSNLTRRVYKNINFYKKYTTNQNTVKKIQVNKQTPVVVTISQKKFNPKCTLYSKKIINTFSVGSIIKYFKVKQAKYIRRSLKGLKIFLNFLKNILEKIYLKQNKNKHILFNITGVDYNLVFLKKKIKTLITKKHNINNLFFLINLRISFSKKKEKKIKAIKKRLKKKIISGFIKNTV